MLYLFLKELTYTQLAFLSFRFERTYTHLAFLFKMLPRQKIGRRISASQVDQCSIFYKTYVAAQCFNYSASYFSRL